MPSAATMMHHIHQVTLWPVGSLAFASSFKRWYYHGTKQPRNTGYQKETNGSSSYRKKRRNAGGSLSVHIILNVVSAVWENSNRANSTFTQTLRKHPASHTGKWQTFTDTVDSQLWQHLLSVWGFWSNLLQQVQSVICIFMTGFPNALGCWLWNVAPKEEQQLFGANYNIVDLKWLYSQALPLEASGWSRHWKLMFGWSSADFKQCFSKQAKQASREKKVKKKNM